MELVNLTARDLWSDGTGWDLGRIMPYVAAERRLDLAAVVLDNVTWSQDRMSWGEASDGKFTVKTAYALLTKDDTPGQNMASFYDHVWKVVAPERVKVFLWLVCNQAIMTNQERHRRHLCDTEICQVCKGGVESIIHVLRDCPAMAGLWTRIVPLRRRNTFFVQSLLEWLDTNLSGEKEAGDKAWYTMFAMAVWWGWKWRCGNLFGENRTWKDRVKFIRDLTKEVLAAKLACGEQRVLAGRVERLISWLPPQSGWYKLNTDGASQGNPGLATAGGCLRNEDGVWCGGFALNIGRCSAPLAELWGVYYGLFIAWEKRITQLELEVDSEMVVGILKTGIGESHPLSFLGFLVKDWTVRITHVYREANRLADGLANYAFTLPLGFHSFCTVPMVVDSIMREDAAGSSYPRLVRL